MHQACSLQAACLLSVPTAPSIKPHNREIVSKRLRSDLLEADPNERKNVVSCETQAVLSVVSKGSLAPGERGGGDRCNQSLP